MTISPRMKSPIGRVSVAATCLLLAACAAATPSPSAAGRAGLVVAHSDGSFSATCVTFEGAEISGEDLLRDSGFEVSLDSGNALGSLVCSIGNDGCAFPDEACLCRCRGAGPCSYWAYFNWDTDSGWTYAVQGAKLRRVHDGDLDAWVWLDRSLPGEAVPLPPADFTFESICG
jgi:hypothetical protein